MNNRRHQRKKYRSFWSLAALALISALVVTGCGGGGGGGSGGGSGASASGSGDNRDFPGSLIGERIEFTVTDAKTASSVSEGLVVVYDFSSDGRVQGTNPATGQVLEPTRYEYEANGTNAVITLFYEYETGSGYEEYILRGNETILSGTYDYEAVVTSPPGASGGGAAAGTYRIVPPNNVSVYGAPNAVQLLPESEEAWQKLTRYDDLIAVSPVGGRDSYVAIQNDGTLVTDTSLKEVGTPSNRVPFKLLSPPSGRFKAVDEPAVLLGMAISEQGELWYWGGEGNLSPRRDTNLQAPVHSFVERYFGQIVISGPDRRPQYTCYTSSGLCSQESEQAALDALGMRDVDKAIFTSQTTGFAIMYTNTINGLLDVASGCSAGTIGCNPPVIPPGLGQILDFDLLRDVFVVAIETSGEVTAWDFQGNLLEVPDEVGTNAVAVAVSGNVSGAHVAIVRSDGTVVVWRYEAGTNALLDVQVPADQQGIKDVNPSGADGYFFFLK